MTPGMTQQEALALLNLRQGATSDDVKQAYRSRIRSTHPDLADDDEDRLRREQDATLTNVALKTLTIYGTGSATSSAPRSTAHAQGTTDSTGMPQGEERSRTSGDPDGKDTTPPAEPQQPPERPQRTAKPDDPKKPVNTPGAPADVSIGLLLLHALMSLNYWYGLVLAMRAAPFVLIGAVLRALGFWTSPFITDTYAELSPASGEWLIAFGSLALIVLIGAIGKSRPATVTLVVSTVLYGSFVEVLAHLSWYQQSLLAGFTVVLPAVLILRHPISTVVTWMRAGLSRK